MSLGSVFFKKQTASNQWWVAGAVWWCFLFHPSLLWSQDATHLLRFSTSDGLPSNNTSCLANDPDGFLWVGTRSGLARFDGQRFAPFRSLCPKAPLPEENVIALLIDRQGFMWVQFPKQLYRVSLATFEAVQMAESWTPQCEDEAGNVYFTCPEGVAVFRQQHQDFERFPLVVQGVQPEVTLICKGRGNLLLVCSAAGLFRFDTRLHSWERLNALGNAAGILSMQVDEAGMLWLSKWGSPENGLIRYDPYADRVLRTFSAGQNGLSSTDLNQICPDGDNVWLATNAGGLCRYAVREDRFYTYGARLGTAGYLWHDQVARLLKDPAGNLWVSSPFFLYQCPVRRTVTTLLSHDPNDPNSLIAPQGTTIATISDHLMVFGTLAGISIFDRQKRSFHNVRLPAYSDYNNQITGLANAIQGGFWVSTWTGLYRLDALNGRILEYFITNTNSKSTHPESVKRLVGAVRRLCADRRGTLWIVNFSNQVFRLDEKDPARVFEPVPVLVADTLSQNDRAEALLDVDDRYFLLGTFDGLVRYDRSIQKFEACPAIFPGLASPVKIESLARSHNGNVLCIANGKPFRLIWTGAGVTVIPLPMPGEVFQAQHIIEDRLGNPWVSTENGVVQISSDASFSLFYDSRNYLNDNVLLLRPTVVPAQDGDGHLYFGGASGVSILNPQDFTLKQTAPPPVKIIDLSINGQPADLDTAIHRLAVLKLPYFQNNLSFAFAALYSAVPERNRFAYRLNGGEWVESGNRNTVNFSHLAPGDYILQVKAANSDGVWNEAGVRLHIIIRPPWWQTSVAYLFYALLIGAGIFAGYRFQLRQKLAEQESRQLREMDAFKSRFFTNITHEFRTPLTVILGMSEQMEKEQTQTQKGEQPTTTGNVIRRNAQGLLRLINQLLDLAKLESNVLKMNYIHGDVLAYLRYIAESLHSYAFVRQVEVQVECEENEILMDYDPERLLQIVQNLLSNAIKFTPPGGQVTLWVGTPEVRSGIPTAMPRNGLPGYLQLTVADTGAGIPADDLPRIFDRFYQAKNQEHNKAGGVGIGLALTQELVKLMGGRIEVESKVGQGTRFTVWLPIATGASVGLTSSHTDTSPSPVMPPLPSQEKSNFEPRTSNLELQKILLIEDNPDVVEYLRLCLVDSYEVHVAYNGRAGIEQALELVPDLIVSDVMMPEKDGFEVCDFLKNDPRTSHIPVILLTARTSVEDRIAGLRRGADAYMAKPFHREEFLVTVANLLEVRKKLQARLRNALTTDDALPMVQEEAETPPELLSVLDIEDVFVQKMRRYVEEHIGQTDLSMDELSRAMTMSYQNLHRKLTALTDLSPVQFIRFIRLQKAKTLLQTTRLSIGDIAFEVGFSDPKYFSRVFTEEFGMPPSAMRG